MLHEVLVSVGQVAAALALLDGAGGGGKPPLLQPATVGVTL